MGDPAPPSSSDRQSEPQSEPSDGTGELERSRAFLRSILENIPDMVFVKDASELRFVRFNAAGERLLGYPREEMLGKNDFDLFPPEEAEFFTRKDREVLEGGKLVDVPEEPIATRTHGERILHTKKIPILDDDGVPQFLLGISEDITDRVEADRALQEAITTAEEANRAKSEFLSRMSHELRTPLNAVLGFAQLLEMDLKDEANLESVRHIITAGSHLLELINDVLDISRIDSGMMSISTEPVDLRELIPECVELTRPLAQRAGVEIVSERPAGRCTVTADRQRLRQVLLNLLSNAIKFNEEAGSVTVGCDAGKGPVTVSVTDTGCGIPQESLPRLFTPYERLDAADRGIEGTGLGLALSKRLCDAMGAELSISSPETGGCRAEVRLQPVRSDGDTTPNESARDEPSGDRTAVSGTILHIEDNPANAELVRRALSGQPGTTVLEARTAAEGLALARSHLPDLVLLDVHLPDAEGTEVLDALRTHHRTAPIPVVVLSADANPEQVERFTRSGAADYLTKPLDVRRLLRITARALEPGPSGR
ncbi:MAG: ATP-binding protein [Microthrixaceae bacterium]|nr:ATP-binding protein [Microthrixaceae bacterium]